MIKEFIIVQITNVGMRDHSRTYIHKEAFKFLQSWQFKEILTPDELLGIFSDEERALSVLQQILDRVTIREGYFTIITVYSSSNPIPQEKRFNFKY